MLERSRSGGTRRIKVGLCLAGAAAIDAGSEVLGDLDQIEKNALDLYATLRSLYRQHRDAEIKATRDDRRMTVPDWYSH